MPSVAIWYGRARRRDDHEKDPSFEPDSGDGILHGHGGSGDRVRFDVGAGERRLVGGAASAHATLVAADDDKKDKKTEKKDKAAADKGGKKEKAPAPAGGGW